MRCGVRGWQCGSCGRGACGCSSRWLGVVEGWMFARAAGSCWQLRCEASSAAVGCSYALFGISVAHCIVDGAITSCATAVLLWGLQQQDASACLLQPACAMAGNVALRECIAWAAWQLQLLQQECDWCAGACVLLCCCHDTHSGAYRVRMTPSGLFLKSVPGVTQSVYLVPLLDKGCSMQAAFFGTVHLRIRLRAAQQLLHATCQAASCAGGMWHAWRLLAAAVDAVPC